MDSASCGGKGFIEMLNLRRYWVLAFLCLEYTIVFIYSYLEIDKLLYHLIVAIIVSDLHRRLDWDII